MFRKCITRISNTSASSVVVVVAAGVVAAGSGIAAMAVGVLAVAGVNITPSNVVEVIKGLCHGALSSKGDADDAIVVTVLALTAGVAVKVLDILEQPNHEVSDILGQQAYVD